MAVKITTVVKVPKYIRRFRNAMTAIFKDDIYPAAVQYDYDQHFFDIFQERGQTDRASKIKPRAASTNRKKLRSVGHTKILVTREDSDPGALQNQLNRLEIRSTGRQGKGTIKGPRQIHPRYKQEMEARSERELNEIFEFINNRASEALEKLENESAEETIRSG